MKISLFNGSPRGSLGNSAQMIKLLLKELPEDTSVHQLKNIDKHHLFIKEWIQSDIAVIIFPLYVDAMPAIVMKFIETLEEYKSELKNKSTYFIIHSGFPESHHSTFVKKYIYELSNKLQLNVIDSFILGANPDKLKLFPLIGQVINNKKIADLELHTNLLFPESFNSVDTKVVDSLVNGINQYMDGRLSNNEVLDKSYDKPYLSPISSEMNKKM